MGRGAEASERVSSEGVLSGAQNIQAGDFGGGDIIDDVFETPSVWLMAGATPPLRGGSSGG